MTPLPLLALVAGLACIAAGLLDLPSVVYVVKPLTTLAILAIAAREARPISTRYRALVVLGLAWSLAGDILLMLPQDRFVLGLLSFLVAHLCYIVAFARTGGGWRDPAAAAGVGAVSLLMLALLWPGLGALRFPVLAYVAVIATMAWQAAARWRHLQSGDAARAAAGAILFLASDSALALRKFRGEFAGATIVVLGTYWVAQYLIARSVRLDAS